MQFDPENHVNKLCGQGMLLEGEGKTDEAAKLFYQAWNDAANDQEKFTAAHFVARHQKDATDKLKWDEIALEFAFKISGEEIKGCYPSLYLNIGKCYEDLQNPTLAIENYRLALSFGSFLSDDGYRRMIKGGIEDGISRVQIESN